MRGGNGINRREFIKLSSAALGGIILSGCGGAGGGTRPTRVPNGYRFFRVKNLSEQIKLPGSSFQIREFLGSTHLSADGLVTFDAEDDGKRRGIFQVALDFAGSKPTIEWERAAVLSGEQLTDQRVVHSWGNYDVDEAGNIAAIIEADLNKSGDGHFGSGLYVNAGGEGFTPILVAGQPFNGGVSKSSGIFYCVSLKNNRMIASLNHLPAGERPSGHQDSLLAIPNVALSESRMLISRGDYLAGTDFRARSFGLLDHNDNGDYTATVFATAPLLEATSAGTTGEMRGSFNFAAHVDSPGDHQMLTASPGAGLNEPVAVGEGGFGPRIGPDGESYVLLRQDDRLILAKDVQTILATGDAAAETKVLHIGTGSVGEDGLYYYSARTLGADWTLFVYDGMEHVPLLSSGDILCDGGAPVARILFGTTKRHVDSENRLVFCCTFTDGTAALVVGIPS